MIKYKVISKYVGQPSSAGETYECREYNKKIASFLEIINAEGHTFISLNTITMGSGIFLRTEIVYRENQTRMVIVEKTSS